jgi:outer membrane protein, heavy metal efflux system
MKLFVKIGFWAMLSTPLLAQKSISQEEVIAQSLQRQPAQKAALLEVKAKKQAEKGAMNLPKPEINAESPTGEFYAVGLLQSFEFPTVYKHRKAVARANTQLAETGAAISENDLKFSIRTYYLEAQANYARWWVWQKRDSIYAQIANSALRQFNAGEIDILQKTLTETEAGKVHQAQLTARQLWAASRATLGDFTGIAESDTLWPLRADSTSIRVQIPDNPQVQLAEQTVFLAEQEAKLARSQNLPDFSVGYLNQGPKNTPLDYRFRATVGIPLWVGQYRSTAQAAQTAVEANTQRAEAQKQAIGRENQRLQAELAAIGQQIRYYEQTALANANTLINAATRMKNAGQIDYITFLKNLDAAFSVEEEYTELLYAYETIRIQLLYLAGK